MDPWLELAKAGPLVFGAGLVIRWLVAQLRAKDAQIQQLVEQARQDQKEHSLQLLESSRYIDKFLRKLAEKSGDRSISPNPRSYP